MPNEKTIIAGKEIKPCPFCGKDEGEDAYDEDRNRVIRCMNCGAVGPWAEQLSDAIEVWNERKEEIMPELNDACEKCGLLKELFERTPESPRDYWLMTEIFVLLHGSDECKVRTINFLR